MIAIYSFHDAKYFVSMPSSVRVGKLHVFYGDLFGIWKGSQCYFHAGEHIGYRTSQDDVMP